MGGPRVDRSHLQVRTLGSYLVIPGNVLLRAIRRPADRISAAVAVLEALRRAETRVQAVIDDAAIELRDKHDVPWSAIGRRVNVDPDHIRHRVTARRRLLHASPVRADDTRAA